ncbi:hypothetical protein MiSe_05900 [Microseira wollei NIES-4236]|uniref:Uncharacterized protein n=1 Tax=Microseira wollei NIES-4236 TaxID=2530354 RepID=A0AAV3WEP9_9CYAN|nr:hypothetical protein MiSe_05900 [Microseira wollei NIES-4236]
MVRYCVNAPYIYRTDYFRSRGLINKLCGDGALHCVNAPYIYRTDYFRSRGLINRLCGDGALHCVNAPYIYRTDYFRSRGLINKLCGDGALHCVNAPYIYRTYIMSAGIGIALMAGLSIQFAWDQRCLVKPAPTKPLTIRVRYYRTRYYVKKPGFGNPVSGFVLG